MTALRRAAILACAQPGTPAEVAARTGRSVGSAATTLGYAHHAGLVDRYRCGTASRGRPLWRYLATPEALRQAAHRARPVVWEALDALAALREGTAAEIGRRAGLPAENVRKALTNAGIQPAGVRGRALVWRA